MRVCAKNPGFFEPYKYLVSSGAITMMPPNDANESCQPRLFKKAGSINRVMVAAIRMIRHGANLRPVYQAMSDIADTRPARMIDGEKPTIAIKLKIKSSANIAPARREILPNTLRVAPIKIERCVPDATTTWVSPATRKLSVKLLESPVLIPIKYATPRLASSAGNKLLIFAAKKSRMLIAGSTSGAKFCSAVALAKPIVIPATKTATAEV